MQGYIVYRDNYKYDYKDKRNDFPLKGIFLNKADADEYIKNYPAIPYHYLKIKKIVIQ